MRLNTLKPAAGAKRPRRRVGRGIGSGLGKTAGRGTKGTGARKNVPAGFEGGQMPLQRRLPKRGFAPPGAGETEEVRLVALGTIAADVIDLAVLREAGLVSAAARSAKVILKGKVERALKLKGVLVTKGARTAIEAAGGSIEA